MNPTEVYRLKLQIDEALRPYGASAVAWPTHWCVLRIVKYDYPASVMLRSTVYSNFIKDEADWLAHKEEIVAELNAQNPRSEPQPASSEAIAKKVIEAGMVSVEPVERPLSWDEDDKRIGGLTGLQRLFSGHHERRGIREALPIFQHDCRC